VQFQSSADPEIGCNCFVLAGQIWGADQVHYPNLRRFAKATHEFAVYIADNADSIINYGERFRAGERISTAFVESTVNTVIGKRFAKRQQMQ
jgi:hypothetical protein